MLEDKKIKKRSVECNRNSHHGRAKVYVVKQKKEEKKNKFMITHKMKVLQDFLIIIFGISVVSKPPS